MEKIFTLMVKYKPRDCEDQPYEVKNAFKRIFTYLIRQKFDYEYDTTFISGLRILKENNLVLLNDTENQIINTDSNNQTSQKV